MPTHNRPGVVRLVATSRACLGALTESLRQEEFGVSRLERVSAEWAWGGADGAGVRVAILDSGVDGSHPMIPRLEPLGRHRRRTKMASSASRTASRSTPPVTAPPAPG